MDISDNVDYFSKKHNVSPPAARLSRMRQIYVCLGVIIFLSALYLTSVQLRFFYTFKSNCLFESTIKQFFEKRVLSDKLKARVKRPNIVLVVTDDQDVELLGAAYMPFTQALVKDRGVNFLNSFVASPLCCPSRASILTGKYVHNHGTLNNSLSGHCSDQHWQKEQEPATLAVYLQSAGYRTLFAGKYLNQYGGEEVGGVDHVPRGWDSWMGLVGNSRYYDYVLSVDGKAEKHANDPGKDYLTNVIRLRALNFLSNQSDFSPFFMMLSTPAAHAPFTYEMKYSSYFQSFNSPRTINFNMKNNNSKHWLLRLGPQPLKNSTIAKVDDIFRNRLRTLLSVDEMVYDVIETLTKMSMLEDTYIIFTSDNGYHLGQFSLPLDKRQPYEFDVRVPLWVRGPGIRAQTEVMYSVSNIDLAPTVLDIAGIRVPDDIDGVSLKPLFTSNDTERSELPKDNGKDTLLLFSNRSLLIEHSGEGLDSQSDECQHLGRDLYGCNPDFECKCSDSFNNTFACTRQLFYSQANMLASESSNKQVTKSRNIIYCEFKDSARFVEYYDLDSDYYQLNNSIDQLNSTLKAQLRNILNILQTCQGLSCRI